MKSRRSKKYRHHKSREQDLVSSFMNLPTGLAEGKPRHPISMETLVERVWEDWGIGEDETAESVISGNWQKIVGKYLSGKCAPINLSKDGKTLQIRASSSTIKQELSFKKTELLKRVNKFKKCQEVVQLRIL